MGEDYSRVILLTALNNLHGGIFLCQSIQFLCLVLVPHNRQDELRGIGQLQELSHETQADASIGSSDENGEHFPGNEITKIIHKFCLRLALRNWFQTLVRPGVE